MEARRTIRRDSGNSLLKPNFNQMNNITSKFNATAVPFQIDAYGNVEQDKQLAGHHQVIQVADDDLKTRSLMEAERTTPAEVRSLREL